MIKVPAAFTSYGVRCVGRWTRNPVRVKRFFGAPMFTPAEHADVNAAKIWPQGLRSPPAEKLHRLQGVAVTLKQEPAGNREELPLQPNTAA